MPFSPSRRAAVVRPVLESLERRSLLSGSAIPLGVAPGEADVAGPQLVSAQLVGPSRGVTQVVLTFNESLDPATAQDPRAFQVLRKIITEEDDSSFFDGPFSSGDETTTNTDVIRLPFTSAVYDDAAKTVTLTPAKPFRPDVRFRQLKVLGKGDKAVKDLAGNPLDGDGDGNNGDNLVQKFKAHRGGKLVIKDADGDKVTLKLKGPGRLVTLSHKKTKGPPDPLVFLDKADPARSVLSATVKRSKRGDGIVDIEQISGTSTATITFLADPAIRIARTEA